MPQNETQNWLKKQVGELIAENFKTFCTLVLTIVGILFWGYVSYNRIVTDELQYASDRPNMIRAERKVDSIERVIYYIKAREKKQDSINTRYNDFLNSLYWGKFPYGKYSNQ